MVFGDRKTPDLCGEPKHAGAVTVRVALLIMLAVAGVALGSASVTAQSQSDTIEISNWTDLDNVRDDLDADYVLVSDLSQDTTGYEEVAAPAANDGTGFNPIGGFSDSDAFFSGTFDGQGNTISDLSVNSTVFGLFSTSIGTIKNLTLRNVSMRGENGSAVVINNAGTVANTAVSGNITGGDVVAGIVGSNQGRGRVINSSVNASVTGTNLIGGLIGANRGDVRNSIVTGDVTGSGETIGGLVGNHEEGSVSESLATGDVTGDNSVGGLVGFNGAEVSESFATGDVTGSGIEPGDLNDAGVGGLVGDNGFGGTVSESFATGDVAAEVNAGGLVGVIYDGNVSESFATGDVTADERAGGLVGQNRGGVTVSESFATGAVTGSSDVGGLVGQLGGDLLDPGEEAILRDSYYDSQATEQQSAVGTIVEDDGTAELRGEVTGLPTSQMQGASAAQNMGALDFTSTWQIVTDPAGYPELQAGPPPAAEIGPDIEDTDSDGDGGNGENGDTDGDGSDAGDDGGSDDGGSDGDGDGRNGDGGNGGNGDDGNGGDGFGPGFGPGVVLAGLSGAGYLLKRRGTTNDTDAE